MSAVDKAFIRAYSRGKTAPQQSGAAEPPAGERPPIGQQMDTDAPAVHRPTAASPDEPKWYRIDQPAADGLPLDVPGLPIALAPNDSAAGKATKHPLTGQPNGQRRLPEETAVQPPAAAPATPPEQPAAAAPRATDVLISGEPDQLLGTGTAQEAAAGCDWILPPAIEHPAAAPVDQMPAAPNGPQMWFRLDSICSDEQRPHTPLAASSLAGDGRLDEQPSLSDLAAELPPPQQPDSPSGGTAASAAPLQPEWEVDQLQWPELCDQLMQLDPPRMTAAASRLLDCARGGRKLLAVTSRLRGEGRTTLAICLARAAAATGARVLLVDADLSQPQLAQQVDVPVPCGWLSAVEQQRPLTESMIWSVADQLALLAASPMAASAELLQRAGRALRALAGAFDLIVLDCGPVAVEPAGPLDPASVPAADAAVLVRNTRQTSADQIQQLVQQLYRHEVEVIGIVENFRLHS